MFKDLFYIAALVATVYGNDCPSGAATDCTTFLKNGGALCQCIASYPYKCYINTTEECTGSQRDLCTKICGEIQRGFCYNNQCFQNDPTWV